MKRSLSIIFIVSAVAISCKSKKNTASTSSGATIEKQLAAVKARFPDATKEELEKGQAVYTGPCTNCHGKKDVTGYTEARLLEIVDVMATKAKITPEEKQALIRFAIGVRETSK